MDPIQLQCGSCGQMMGISPEHLGAQVQCPHCQAIVQTPAPTPPAAPAPVELAAVPALNVGEHESIFSQPEPADDLFGAAPAPQIELPKLDIPAPAPPEPEPPPAVHFHPALETPPAPAPMFSEAMAEGPAPDLGAIAAPRRVPPPSNLAPTLLIFLVPYAIFTTAFIGYLLYTWPKGDNPLKNLPDTSSKGQPRFQVRHDYELAPSMKTALGQPIRVNAIEITPLRVKHTAENDLVLVFRAKNVSSNQVFNPIADEYMKFSRKSMDRGMPYTFLERLHRDKLARMYGGYLEWYRGNKQVPGGFEIGPGEEATIHLISEIDYRKREVNNFVSAKERLLWRLQVRQGLVHVDGKDVSATTVIGVEFSARDIAPEKG